MRRGSSCRCVTCSRSAHGMRRRTRRRACGCSTPPEHKAADPLPEVAREQADAARAARVRPTQARRRADAAAPARLGERAAPQRRRARRGFFSLPAIVAQGTAQRLETHAQVKAFNVAAAVRRAPARRRSRPALRRRHLPAHAAAQPRLHREGPSRARRLRAARPQDLGVARGAQHPGRADRAGRAGGRAAAAASRRSRGRGPRARRGCRAAVRGRAQYGSRSRSTVPSPRRAAAQQEQRDDEPQDAADHEDDPDRRDVRGPIPARSPRSRGWRRRRSGRCWCRCPRNALVPTPGRPNAGG